VRVSTCGGGSAPASVGESRSVASLASCGPSESRCPRPQNLSPPGWLVASRVTDTSLRDSAGRRGAGARTTRTAPAVTVRGRCVRPCARHSAHCASEVPGPPGAGGPRAPDSESPGRGTCEWSFRMAKLPVPAELPSRSEETEGSLPFQGSRSGIIPQTCTSAASASATGSLSEAPSRLLFCPPPAGRAGRAPARTPDRSPK
jgi:hypothetical protein